MTPDIIADRNLSAAVARTVEDWQPRIGQILRELHRRGEPMERAERIVTEAAGSNLFARSGLLTLVHEIWDVPS